MAQHQETVSTQRKYRKTTAAEVLIGKAAAESQRSPLSASVTARYEPNPDEISDLIKRAHAHPLGIEFLHQGMLDAVAATFSVHAFVVEKARTTKTSP